MDAMSNVPKRNTLAQHLREVIDVLEQKVCFNICDQEFSLIIGLVGRSNSLFV
jgi:hypothetical protein